MQKAKQLRELFKGNKVIQVVGAHDGLSAKLIEQNGFDAIWASGLEISTSHAVPDANILTMSEYLERACEMNNATSIPVIADCDTGYGNANNVIHMVQKYEAAGIAGACIEDKLFPKVNSFVPGRQELASISEFVGKIMAAKHAQSGDDFVVIARVEALIAGWGMDEALKRANAYADAGADAILIHSKSKTPDEIKEFCQKWDHRVPVVIVPTTYPDFHINEMNEFRIKMTIYANHGIRASIKAMNDVFAEIKKVNKTSTVESKIVAMDHVFDLQGMTKMKQTEKKYLKTEANSLAVIIPAAGDPGYDASMKEITKDCPIAMLDINGKPILARNVEVLNRLGITDITVITGFNAEKFNVPDVRYIPNPQFEKTSQIDSIFLSEDKFDQNILIAFSDILFEKDVITRLVETGADVVLAIDSAIPSKAQRVDYCVAEHAPVETSRRMSPNRLNRILQIGKDIDPKEANFEFIGLSYFSKKGSKLFKEHYHQLQKARQDEQSSQSIDFLDVIQTMIDQGVTVSSVEVNGGWMEIRSLENYKSAHVLY